MNYRVMVPEDSPQLTLRVYEKSLLVGENHWYLVRTITYFRIWEAR